MAISSMVIHSAPSRAKTLWLPVAAESIIIVVRCARLTRPRHSPMRRVDPLLESHQIIPNDKQTTIAHSAQPLPSMKISRSVKRETGVSQFGLSRHINRMVTTSILRVRHLISVRYEMDWIELAPVLLMIGLHCARRSVPHCRHGFAVKLDRTDCDCTQ